MHIKSQGYANVGKQVCNAPEYEKRDIDILLTSHQFYINTNYELVIKCKIAGNM